MNRSPSWELMLSFFILVAGFTILTGCRESAGEVMLTATPSKTTYSTGERIKILLTLQNNTDGTVGLSTLVEGNIRVVSLKRNGIDVQSRTVPIFFDDDLGSILQQSLGAVSSGQSASISWKSTIDRVQAGQALRTVQYQPDGDHQATHYLVSEPGTYELSVVYKYPGPTNGFPQVFQRETNAAPTTFTVGP